MNFLIHTLIIQAAVGLAAIAVRRFVPAVDAMFVFVGGALAASIAGLFFSPPYAKLLVAAFAISQGAIFVVLYIVAILVIGAFDDEV